MGVPDTEAVRIAAGVLSTLTARGQTLATAESLTGGLIGATLTEVPGASAAYVGGVVVYATAMKARLAGVPLDVLDAHGPVSPQTAAALARGVVAGTGADFGIAVTGVAGPEPQDGHAPGQVWVGLAGPDGVAVRRFDLDGDRAGIREATVEAALGLLASELQRQGTTTHPRGVVPPSGE